MYVASVSIFKHILSGDGVDPTPASVGQPQNNTIPISRASGNMKHLEINLTNMCKTCTLKTTNMVDRN